MTLAVNPPFLVAATQNKTMAPIQTRMPAIVDDLNWDTSLGGSAGTELPKPSPNDLLMTGPISTAVSKVTNDGPALPEAIFGPEVQEPA